MTDIILTKLDNRGDDWTINSSPCSPRDGLLTNNVNQKRGLTVPMLTNDSFRNYDQSFIKQFLRCTPSDPGGFQSRDILEKSGVRQFVKYSDNNLAHYITFEFKSSQKYISLIDLKPDDAAFLIVET